MAFEPDIIVTGPEPSEIALVVEVKTSARAIEDSERQLKSYMANVRSPVGLLVTPERMFLYHDLYLPSTDESITKVGEFDMRNLLHFSTTGDGRADALAFERQVQSWLEDLYTETGLRRLPPELRRIAERYIIPALSQGPVRSGRPRLHIPA